MKGCDFISKANFDLTYKRKALQLKKRRRKAIFFTSVLFITLFSLILTLFILSSNRNKTIATFNLAIPKVVEEPLYVVCIDPGHGDWDYGGISPNGSAEKDIVLSVALKLGYLLEEEGSFKVIYTRGTDKMDWVETANDSLKERLKVSEICNADIFISIHCNISSESRDISGVETWYKPDDEDSITLSKYLQQSLVDLDYTNNRGVKEYVPGEELAVLELNTTTSSLIELGFLTNSLDEKYLISDFGQSQCAKALFEAIVSYKNDTKK